MTKVQCVQGGILPLFRNIGKSEMKLIVNRTMSASGVYGNIANDTFLSSKIGSSEKNL